MRKVLLCALALCTSSAFAEVFTFTLYSSASNNDGKTIFFEDYVASSMCTIEIDDSAIAAKSFVKFTDPELRRFECSLRGSDTTYSFSFGPDAPEMDYGSPISSADSEYGLLFDDNGKPLRFDSPKLSFASIGLGFYDRPADFDDNPYDGSPPRPPSSGTTSDSHISFPIDDSFDTPTAVLLEPTYIGGSTRPRGALVGSTNLPQGTKAALLNGQFRFQEQFYRDSDRKRIPAKALLRGYYTFDGKLSIPTLRVTQAVFQDEKSELRLVDKRTTAIIVNTGEYFIGSPINLEIVRKENDEVVFTGENSSFELVDDFTQLIFYCNSLNNYCNLDNGKQYEIRIGYGNNGMFLSKAVLVLASKALLVSYIHLLPSACPECALSETVQSDFLERNLNFIQRSFPYPDQAVISKNLPALQSDSLPDMDEETIGGCKYRLPQGIVVDLRALTHRLEKTPKFSGNSRIVALISDKYLSYHDYRGSRGFWNPNFPKVIVAVANRPSVLGVEYSGNNDFVVAHELGHSYGIPHHDYADPNNPCMRREHADSLEGFDVYSKNHLHEAKNLMGQVYFDLNPLNEVASAERWITTDNWNEIANKNLKQGEDPVLLVLEVEVTKNGSANFGEFSVAEGYPHPPEPGEYAVKIYDHNNNLLSTTVFSAHFCTDEKIEEICFNRVQRIFSIPYLDGSARIAVFSPTGEKLDESDFSSLMVNSVSQTLGRVPGRCLTDGNLVRFQNDLMKFKEDISRGISGSDPRTINLVDQFSKYIREKIKPDCEMEAEIWGDLENLTLPLDKLKSDLSLRYGGIAQINGDLNNDGLLDQADYQLIRSSLNKCSGQAGFIAAADLNGNGCVAYDDYQAWYAIYQKR